MHTAQVIPFKFEAREVRTLLIDDQPWFVAVDVCASLGLNGTNKALIGLDEDEKREHEQYSCSGRKPILINESGLYSLILRSRKAEAKRFKKWITAEVLPSIRKQGSYTDTHNKMGTLIGETIGTNGFNMLGAVVKGKVSSLPVPIQRRATAKIWSQTHAAFGVRSAADIPATQLDAARNFIAAYALEGEWLGRDDGNALPEEGIRLSRNETQHLYLLMSRYFIMGLHKDQLRAASLALDSGPLKSVWGQLHEGFFNFKALDARRSEIYSEYRALGVDGGYAARA